jgi:LuxR family maltose regulon positive regulatory protein
MDSTLLATKLLIPPQRQDYIERSRLDYSLSAILDRPLTVVSAPPGSGKTALLSAWLKRIGRDTGIRTGWVSLDSEDNDPLRFWNYVAAAFSGIEELSGLTHLLDSPTTMTTFVKAWINMLVAVPGSLVLVLDDYHLIADPAVHNSVLYLLEHIPAHLHVVINSRTDPPLPLGRWRARGQLVEIRLAHLRFTQEESAAFLERQTGIKLLSQQVEEIEKRTEGWAAGLQVVALSLKDQQPESLDRRIGAFSGRHRFVLDYLTDEVLCRQPHEVQAFLMITAILRRFSAPLCRELLSEAGWVGPDVQGLLAKLERDNLFIIALDEERTWYRYHHLFGELLQARLREEMSPDRIDRLYRRAAEWHRAQGGIAEMVTYALAAHDQALAADLLNEAVQQVEVWSQGEIRTVLGWIKTLAPEMIAERPWLQLYQSRALFVAGRLVEAEVVLAQLEARRVEADAPLAAQLAGSRARIAAARGEVRLAEEAAQRALATLPATALLARSSAASSLGYVLLLKGDLQEAQSWMTRALREARANGFRLLEINVLANIGWGYLLQGQVELAEQVIAEGILRGTLGGQLIPAAGLMFILRAERCYDRGELAEAEQNAREGLALLAQGGIEDISQKGNLLLAQLLQLRGDSLGAAQRIEQVMQNATRSGIERSQRMAGAYRALLDLRQDHLYPAQAWATAYRLLPGVEYLHEIEDLILVRVLLASGDPDEALEVCQSVQTRAEAGGRMRRVLEARMLQAQALHALHRPDSARAALRQSLLLAQAQGVRQVYSAEGERLRPLLREAARQGESLPWLDSLLADTQPAAQSAPDLRQALSERELEVLKLLAAGLSNREIAARLVVAETTVKKHITHLFDKLDVTSRTQALVRARELGIL